MRVWFDTEFIDLGNTVLLLSIGMVRQDGLTYYAEPAETDRSLACEWVQKNVIPHLHGPVKPSAVMVNEIIQFCDMHPQFWGYYADYDWMLFCALFGGMLKLPPTWPNLCLDIQQERIRLGVKELPKQESTEHHALNDALWTRQAHDYLASLRIAR